MVTFPTDFTKSLEHHFSQEEVSGLIVKADGLIASDGFREGFQEGAFLVNSGFSDPHRVICYRSGKTTCTCSFFNRNNLYFHALPIAKHKDRLPGLLKHYPGRNLNRMATNTAPKGVGGKVPPRRKPLKEASTSSRDTCTEVTEQLCVEQVDATKIVVLRNVKPEDPPVTAPLVVKKIGGGIRNCAGCTKDIKSVVVGYNQAEDSEYCLARHEAYHFWNKNGNCYKLTSGARRYHIKSVCTRAHQSLSKKISKGSQVLPEGLLTLTRERFHHFLITD